MTAPAEISEKEWCSVKEVRALTGLATSTLYSMRVPLVRNPEPIKGKLRFYNHRIPGIKRPLVRIVAADVTLNFPPPAQILAEQGRNFSKPKLVRMK